MDRPGNAPWHVEKITPAGVGQSDATSIPIKSSPAIVVVTGNSVGGIVLPTASKGKVFVIWNAGTTGLQVLFVYPTINDQINSLGANVALQMQPQTSAMFIAVDSLTWLTTPTVPS